jgi:small subunit ribosomal protein S18
MVMTTPAAPTATPGATTTGTGMGPRPSGPGGRRRPGEFGGGSRKFTPRRKVCQFCVDKIKEVDYKDLTRLRRFLSERGKIEPRRKTGTCAAHQRSLNVALKRARQLALLPFTAEHIRVTGVLVREPGAPPFRGARPRPAELEAAPEAAPADGTAEAAAEAPTADGTAEQSPVAAPAAEAAPETAPASEPVPEPAATAAPATEA